jgi:hypothetical protein
MQSVKPYVRLGPEFTGIRFGSMVRQPLRSESKATSVDRFPIGIAAWRRSLWRDSSLSMFRIKVRQEVGQIEDLRS